MVIGALKSLRTETRGQVETGRKYKETADRSLTHGDTNTG